MAGAAACRVGEQGRPEGLEHAPVSGQPGAIRRSRERTGIAGKARLAHQQAARRPTQAVARGSTGYQGPVTAACTPVARKGTSGERPTGLRKRPAPALAEQPLVAPLELLQGHRLVVRAVQMARHRTHPEPAAALPELGRRRTHLLHVGDGTRAGNAGKRGGNAEEGGARRARSSPSGERGPPGPSSTHVGTGPVSSPGGSRWGPKGGGCPPWARHGEARRWGAFASDNGRSGKYAKGLGILTVLRTLLDLISLG